MGDKTGIEWTDATWNPTTGCDKVSPGCDNCYALTQAKRLKAMGQPKYQTDGSPRTSGPGFGFAMHPSALDQPLRWSRPRRIFVNSMSDLFHGDATREFVAKVWAVMAAAPWHTFQVLTKRPAIARSMLSDDRFRELVNAEYWMLEPREPDDSQGWPLENVWLGTSVEDQKRANQRIPALLDTPAAVRFLSCEPLLGPVDLVPALRLWAESTGPGAEVQINEHLHWVIAGGESGPNARPMHPGWVRALRDQCGQAEVAFHFKQWGEFAPGQLDSGTRKGMVGTGFYSGPGLTGTYETMTRVGKHTAGRELDGRTWDEWPEVAAPA